MGGYYNTTAISGEALKEAKEKAETQEEKITSFFAGRKSARGYTADTVNALCLPEAPLTSVRRAITNLKDAGVLIKTIYREKGRYGRLCYVWKLKTE